MWGLTHASFDIKDTELGGLADFGIAKIGVQQESGDGYGIDPNNRPAQPTYDLLCILVN